MNPPSAFLQKITRKDRLIGRVELLGSSSDLLYAWTSEVLHGVSNGWKRREGDDRKEKEVEAVGEKS